MLLFWCLSVLTVVNKRKATFLADYLKSCNSLCRLFGHVAQNELKDLQSLLEQQPNVTAFILLGFTISMVKTIVFVSIIRLHHYQW